MKDSDAKQLRTLYPRLLAKTLGLTSCLPDAEDAVHDAIERALVHWPATGRPAVPEAWLLKVAANAHRDRLRKRKREDLKPDALETLAQMSPWVRIAVGEPSVIRPFKDDLLRLLFSCCHPVLQPGESAALALATVVGLSGGEVAAAFATTPRSMEQRLNRARQRLRSHGNCEEVSAERAVERQGAVLTVVHLLYNEGYWSFNKNTPIRPELCRLALGLARSLRDEYPKATEVGGLLALLLLHEARRPARLDARDNVVPLNKQDRGLWLQAGIAEATTLLEQTLQQSAPGPFQVEAAISAVHCRARTAAETDWQEIAALYALLETFRPTPAIRVNRAYAVGQAQGATAGLSLLDLDGGATANRCDYVHVVRSALLEDLGRLEDAREALEQALGLARNEQERRHLTERMRELGSQLGC